VLPYNNQLFLMKLKGAVLLEILEAGYSTAPAANGAFPQLAGIKVTVRTGVPYEKGRQYPNSTYFAPAKPGSRVTVEEINGKPFDPDKEYVLAAPEFLCRGGDTYGALAEEGAAEIRGTGYIDTDAVLNFLAELGGTVGEPYAEPAGRVRLVE
jgi:5'-nucleotidase